MKHDRFDERLHRGLEVQTAMARYLDQWLGCRVYVADKTASGDAFRDENNLPIPDLLKLTRGHRPHWVEVKSKAEWFQVGGNRGPLETILDYRDLDAYSKVEEDYSQAMILVFVIRGTLSEGYQRGQEHRLGGRVEVRGHAGCYYATLEDLRAARATAPPRANATAMALFRIRDGGPLRALCPWDEATKSVPVDPAAWAAWLAIEPESATPALKVTRQSGPQCGSADR